MAQQFMVLAAKGWCPEFNPWNPHKVGGKQLSSDLHTRAHVYSMHTYNHRLGVRSGAWWCTPLISVVRRQR